MALRLPRTAAEAESQAGHEHTVSNDHLELSVQLPRNGVCCAGAILRVRARARQKHDGDALSLRLIGETSARLMGKARLQNAAIVSMTTTVGGELPMSGFERFTFLDEEVALPESTPTFAPSSTSQSNSDIPTSSKEDKSALEPYIDAEGFIKLAIPFPPQEQLLPSLPKQTNAALEQTDISVQWTLQLVATRKGFFRVNKKLSLELPVSFPTIPWRQTYPSEVSVPKKLKFEGNEAEDLSVEARLSCRPITTLGSPIKFVLHLTPNRQQVASLLAGASFTSTAPTCFLVRQVRTAPIQAKSSGREYTWAAQRIGKAGEVRKVERHAADHGLEWAGEVTPPEGEYTVDSNGVSVNYSLIVQISSSIFADGTLRVSLPVFLPSAPIEVDGPHRDFDPPADQAPDPEYLPVYKPHTVV
ncbi:hypothetical protein JCM11251_006247 [Rhodosporidiobolus azoricus]